MRESLESIQKDYLEKYTEGCLREESVINNAEFLTLVTVGSTE